MVITGGRSCEDLVCHNFDDVMKLDTKTFKWEKIGSMETGRWYHGVSLVNIENVVEYCN